jgi:hypothetical protein
VNGSLSLALVVVWDISVSKLYFQATSCFLISLPSCSIRGGHGSSCSCHWWVVLHISFHCLSHACNVDTGDVKKELAFKLGAEKWVDFRETKDLIADIKAATDGIGPHAAVIAAGDVGPFISFAAFDFDHSHPAPPIQSSD